MLLQDEARTFWTASASSCLHSTLMNTCFLARPRSRCVCHERSLNIRQLHLLARDDKASVHHAALLGILSERLSQHNLPLPDLNICNKVPSLMVLVSLNHLIETLVPSRCVYPTFPDLSKGARISHRVVTPQGLLRWREGEIPVGL
jgi:hypothetical protein